MARLGALSVTGEDSGLTVDIVEEYRQQGFIVVRNLFSKEARETFQRTLRAMIVAQAECNGLLGELGAIPDSDDLFFRDFVQRVDLRCHAVIWCIYESIWATSAAQAFYGNSRLIEIAAALLGVDRAGLFLNSNRIRIDPPGPSAYRLGWHQEISYTQSRAPSLQFWSALLWPSSWENGSIEVAVGSHRNGDVKSPLANPAAAGSQQWLVPEQIVYRHPIRLVEIDPGDVLIFSCELFHRSSDPRRQQQMKYSVVGRYSDATSPKFSIAPPKFP